MTHLTQRHLIVATGNKIIALPAMGVVTGDTGKFTPLAPFGDIGFPGNGVPLAAAQRYRVYPRGNMLVTGEAESVNRLPKLAGSIAVVGIVTDFAHVAGKGAMQQLEPLELFLLVLMAGKTEVALPPHRCILRLPICRMTGGAGKHGDRRMNALHVRHPFMAGVTGTVPVGLGKLLGSRAHGMTGNAKGFDLGSMHDRRGELFGDVDLLVRRGIEDNRLVLLKLLLPLVQVHGNLVFPLVPQRLENEKIPEGPPVLGGTDRQRIAGNAVHRNHHGGSVGGAEFEHEVPRLGDHRGGLGIDHLHRSHGRGHRHEHQKKEDGKPEGAHREVNSANEHGNGSPCRSSDYFPPP